VLILLQGGHLLDLLRGLAAGDDAFSRILMHLYACVCICMHLEAVMKQV
jgi:hypothetical protein